jgi:phosphomevalonate kinase
VTKKNQKSKPRAITVIFTGKMKSGKDYNATILREKRPEFVRIALADSLKVIVATVKGIPLEELEAFKHQHRQDLIFAGKVGRAIDTDVWIKRLPHVPLFHGCTVITDVRFKNEFYYFKQLKSESHQVYFIKIHADEATRLARGAQPAFFDDPSERDLDDIPLVEYDFIIENSTHDEKTAHEQVDIFANKFLA